MLPGRVLHGRPWLREVMHYLQANRDYLVNYVNENLPGIRMWSPEGTFLGWLDCRQLEVESPHRFFLDEAKVGFNDGISFGEDGQGFLRINFGCPRAMLDEGLVRMKRLSNYKPMSPQLISAQPSSAEKSAGRAALFTQTLSYFYC